MIDPMDAKHNRDLNLIGSQFGLLKVTGFAYKADKKRWWNTVCECGTARVVSTGPLQYGKATTCKLHYKKLAKLEKTAMSSRAQIEHFKLSHYWSSFEDFAVHDLATHCRVSAERARQIISDFRPQLDRVTMNNRGAKYKRKADNKLLLQKWGGLPNANSLTLAQQSNRFGTYSSVVAQ